ncbi:MAG: alkaline phosphatase [Betaproteobacteria bacterium]|nr:alkaline phosphatase [Betaproteobacteria bacterium]
MPTIAKPHAIPDRRQWLQAALAASATIWLPRSVWSQPRLTQSPFALGVASGSPTHDSVVIWTRLLGEGVRAAGEITVQWELADDEGFTRAVRRGQATARAELAHAVHVEVPGLEADRVYHYRFRIGGNGQDWTSTAGRTRTLPRPDAQVARWRLAYASCQRWEHGYFSAWRHMRDDAPDLVLFLGDYIYEYPSAQRSVRLSNGQWVITLDDYRERYALYKSDPDLQAMHAACPWMITWDDHEVQNDYAGVRSGDGGPEVADFRLRRAQAYQAWYEHMPVRASVLPRVIASLAQGEAMRIHGSARIGRLASVHLLDARQYRDPQACTPNGRAGSAMLDPDTCAEWDDPARSLLGTAQSQWLVDSLTRDAARWQFIAQQSLFAPRDYRPGPQRYVWNDGWDGYAAERQRIATALAAQRRARPDFNAVFLGGDIHENWVGHVKTDYQQPSAAAVATEFCGTSISSRSGVSNARLPDRLAENPHFVFADSEKRGYGIVDVQAERITTRLRVLDDATRIDASVSTLAQFSVPSGQPRIERI